MDDYIFQGKPHGHGKVPVSTRAVIARINRKLKPENQQLKVARGASARSNLGDYYVLDVNRNMIVDYRFDLAALARRHGALEEWEVVEG